MSNHLTREAILGAFGVTEADIAAIDNGYTEARFAADAERAEFLAWAEKVRAQVEADLTASSDDAG